MRSTWRLHRRAHRDRFPCRCRLARDNSRSCGIYYRLHVVYGTGGLAIAGAEASITNVDTPGDTRSDSNTHLGWVIGAGAEFMITETMSLGAEYLHVDLGSEDYTFPGPGGGIDVLSESDLQINIVRASLNLRF